MSESLHELEAALADAQREAALAEDEWTRRRQRYDAKPTEKRLQHMLNANRTAYVTKGAFYRAQEAVERARRAQEHPPLKEGLSTRVTDEDLAKLRAEGQLFDVAAADAVNELDNPASPIVEVDAASGPTPEDIAHYDGMAEGYNDAPDEPTTSTPVVTLAPVNGDGRFVPTADADLPILNETREWAAIGTIADGPAKGATAYMNISGGETVDSRYATEACPCHYCTERRNEGLPNAFGPGANQDERDTTESALGYTRNEQGAYEYDGPVGEQPDVPEWDIDAPGSWKFDVDKGQWIGPQISNPHGPDSRAPKEPRVITTRRLGERFQNLPVYVQDGIAKDTVYVLPGTGSREGAVLMGSDTFAALKSKMDEVRPPNPDVASAADLKAKLERIRNIARSVGALDGWAPVAPVTKAEPDEAQAQPTAEEQSVIAAGKAAQDRWLTDHLFTAPLGTPGLGGPFGYTEQFAKAGDVPSAPADHVTGFTVPESVTVDTERDVQQFGSDTVKLKSQTVTGSFTMTEAQPEHFQKIFPNARVVIGSDGKVDITANTAARAAEHVAASKPTTPEGKLLAEAAQVIGQDRNDQYGNAEDSFGVIAAFWNTWLTARWREVIDFSIDIDTVDRAYFELKAADVANMLGLMKKARTAVGGHKRDNYVDEAGYVALAERCEAKGSGL